MTPAYGSTLGYKRLSFTDMVFPFKYLNFEAADTMACSKKI